MKKASVTGTEAFQDSSLTMSYFHTGTRNIIGAEAFHCPVRDGKEWDHLAMVVRHNRHPLHSGSWANSQSRPRLRPIRFSIVSPIAKNGANALDSPRRPRVVKVIGSSRTSN